MEIINIQCIHELVIKKSVSEQNQTLGESAGYFLYETYDGFKFKSIDGLFAQKPKKSYIYNNTELLPAGYDGKALTYKKDNNVHAESKFKFGAYHTRVFYLIPLLLSTKLERSR